MQALLTVDRRQACRSFGAYTDRTRRETCTPILTSSKARANCRINFMRISFVEMRRVWGERASSQASSTVEL